MITQILNDRTTKNELERVEFKASPVVLIAVQLYQGAIEKSSALYHNAIKITMLSKRVTTPGLGIVRSSSDYAEQSRNMLLVHQLGKLLCG